jgi:hypothetical protein
VERVNDLLDRLGATVGDVVGSVPVRLLAFTVTAYVTVLWLATAYWVYRDMRRRVANPITPYLAALAIVLASPALLPISAFTYWILRPRETLAEGRERELVERLDGLNAEVDLACPGCRRPVEPDWLACPACRTQLARRCRACRRTMGLDWAVCGWCGAGFGRKVARHALPVATRASASSTRRSDTPRRNAPNRVLQPGR